MPALKKLVVFVLLCFVAPALTSLAVRAASSQPGSWRTADWSSSGLLPVAANQPEAAVHVMAARTWYSNPPEVLAEVHGAEAARLIPTIEAAVRSYPFSGRGDYTIWPGPNSNSFVAHVLRQVPELHLALPPEAVGRDFRPFGEFVTL